MMMQTMFGHGFGCLMAGGRFGMMWIGLLLVGLVAFLVYQPTKKANSATMQPAAQEAVAALDLRLAKGEISEAEYRSIKDALLK